MTENDRGLASLIEAAEAEGRRFAELDARNRRRAAKGRPPLPDPTERRELEFARRRYRTGDSTVVAGADAIKLFEVRKAEMTDADEKDEAYLESLLDPASGAVRRKGQRQPASASALAWVFAGASRRGPRKGRQALSDEDAAVREAAAARRVQDLKNGRVDHGGNWSEGQELDGGDETRLASAPWQGASTPPDELPAPAAPAAPVTPQIPPAPAGLEAFRDDLYQRLRVSFEALEDSLSDLQGRVAEIVTATTPERPAKDAAARDEFDALLSGTTPVVFDIGGTRVSCDAVCVFYAPPCITVVFREGSAKIVPKPGAQLRLTYESGGTRYADDLVTFLGTRFDLPMFGLSFVGFIRNADADAPSDQEADA